MSKNKKPVDPVATSSDDFTNTMPAADATVPDSVGVEDPTVYNQKPEDITYNPPKSDGRLPNFTENPPKDVDDQTEILAENGGMNRPVREKGTIKESVDEAELAPAVKPEPETFKSAADGQTYRDENGELVRTEVVYEVPATFSRGDLIEFGKYLLSEKRRKKIDWTTVHDSDIEDFYRSLGTR